MKTMMKPMKVLALFLACVLLSTMMFGCASDATETTTTQTTKPTEPSKPSEPASTELADELAKRDIPELMSREEMLEILQREVYGYLPEAPESISFSVEKNYVNNYCAGKATLDRVTANCIIRGKEFSFPFFVAIPKTEGKHPFFVHINVLSRETNRYQPTEELIDNGFAVLSFYYVDVTSDDSDMTSGLAGVLYENGQRGVSDAGKLMMWAWAAHRVMDYAETISDRLDMDCAAVCGHSRGGKMALLAAATDERFDIAYSNDSGCMGAALTTGKKQEDISSICGSNPFWVCENLYNYIGEEVLPFDQHFLLACIAPRKVLVGSASEDYNADPLSEQLACLAASSAFENGYVGTTIAEAGDEFFEGDIAYHLREGKHYFNREDWQKLMKYVKMHYEF